MDLNPAPIESMPKQDRRTWWATLLLLCGILGAMLGLSVRTQQKIKNTVAPSAINIDTNQVREQQRTIKSQQDHIAKLEQSIASGSSHNMLLLEDLKSAKFLAGLTSVKGPGIVVTLNDSKKPYTNMLPSNFPPPNIIHDTDINQIINELKQAGAEAVSVNDQRLVAVSAVRCAGPTVYVNNTQAAPPFVIRAIGDPKTLLPALNFPGGVADTASHFDPAMVKSEVVKHLTIPAYSGAIPSKYAMPVSAPTEKSQGA